MDDSVPTTASVFGDYEKKENGPRWVPEDFVLKKNEYDRRHFNFLIHSPQN